MLTKVFDISDNSIDQEDPEEISQEDPEEISHEDPEEISQEDPEEISQEDPEEIFLEDPEDSFDVYYYYQISENSVSSNCVTFDQLAFFDTTIIFLLACVLGALVFNAFMKKL